MPEDNKTETAIRVASWKPVNRTIPEKVRSEVNTNVLIIPINKIVLIKDSQFMPVTVRFSLIRIAKNKQILVTPRSRKKIIQRGTMLIFFRMFCISKFFGFTWLRQSQSQYDAEKITD
jgi:hypothetical protein